jgi:hypothetical protein
MMRSQSTWTRTDADGTTQLVAITEHEPGFYLVQTELMHQMLRQLGFQEAPDPLSKGNNR